MARPRKKNSKNSLGGLGMETYEDETINKRLAERDISLRWLIRKLLRDWLKETKPR